MRRTTAIRHLEELAESASTLLTGRARAALLSMWVGGELLDPVEELERGTVILLLDVPAAELPWLSVHPVEYGFNDDLRLGKRPILWYTRPSAWPAWTYRDRRVARFWTAAGGLDESAIEALRERRLPPVVEPTDAELVAQCRVELGVARTHLRHVLDHYRDYPQPRGRSREDREDELWRAAEAVLELGEVGEGTP